MVFNEFHDPQETVNIGTGIKKSNKIWVVIDIDTPKVGYFITCMDCFGNLNYLDGDLKSMDDQNKGYIVGSLKPLKSL